MGGKDNTVGNNRLSDANRCKKKLIVSGHLTQFPYLSSFSNSLFDAARCDTISSAEQPCDLSLQGIIQFLRGLLIDAQYDNIGGNGAFPSHETICHDNLPRFNAANCCMWRHDQSLRQNTLHPRHYIVGSNEITSNIPIFRYHLDDMSSAYEQFSH